MQGKDSAEGPKPSATERGRRDRQGRLADRLRDNLKRRKTQSRARVAAENADPPHAKDAGNDGVATPSPGAKQED